MTCSLNLRAMSFRILTTDTSHIRAYIARSRRGTMEQPALSECRTQEATMPVALTVANVTPGSACNARGSALQAYEVDRLFAAYACCGGMMHCEDLLPLLRQCNTQPLSKLAQWIVRREVVCLELEGQFWLPLFQFQPKDMDVRPSARKVMTELTPVFDQAELLAWFVQPNSWLAHRLPALALDDDPECVLQAARADRFIAAGG